jgi:hypothetical protein
LVTLKERTNWSTITSQGRENCGDIVGGGCRN